MHLGFGLGLCEFALDNAAVGDADPIVSVRQHAHEMHEAPPADAFEAFKLNKRLGVIVDRKTGSQPDLLAAPA